MEEPLPPREINPALPPAVESIILRGMSKQAEERAPSCMAFIDALDTAWKNSRVTLTNAHDPESTQVAPWSNAQADYLPTQLTSRPTPTNGSGQTQGQTPATPPSAPLNTQVPHRNLRPCPQGLITRSSLDPCPPTRQHPFPIRNDVRD
ncbi:hypothetical protein [Ktedonospora formicarum]|nr:hypothetical protein [Ktedonospora formicarum]